MMFVVKKGIQTGRRHRSLSAKKRRDEKARVKRAYRHLINQRLHALAVGGDVDTFNPTPRGRGGLYTDCDVA